MLCPLMEYTHKRCFPNNYKFTVKEKLALTPDIIERYLKRRIYDNENAIEDIDPPLNYRSATVKC